jgi:hypothetical protein
MSTIYVCFYEHSVINSTSDLLTFVHLYIFLVTFSAKSHFFRQKEDPSITGIKYSLFIICKLSSWMD